MSELSGLEMRRPDNAIFLKISDYENLIRESEKAQVIQQAIYSGVPHEVINKLISGNVKPPELEEYEKTGMSPDEIRKVCIQLEEAKTSINIYAEKERTLQEMLVSLQEKYDEMKNLADDLGEQLEEEKAKREAAEKKKKEEKEPKAKTKRQAANKINLDTGKIRALRNAGWSFAKIADEMGCSPQTVANALQREQDEQPEQNGEEEEHATD